MKKWEYKILICQDSPANVEKRLNDLGKDGWRVINITEAGAVSMEREVPEPPVNSNFFDSDGRNPVPLPDPDDHIDDPRR